MAVSEKIAIAFAEADACEARSLVVRVDVRQLLRDALGEFISARSPVESYVQKRYGFEPGSTVHADKVHEVAIRSRLAKLLKRAEPEFQTVTVSACSIYKLVLLEEVQLAALAGDTEEARRERRRLWARVGYDVHIRFVVAARSESKAREIACEYARETYRVEGLSFEAGTSGPLPNKYEEDAARRWLDPTRSICELIGIAAGEDAAAEHVVSASFRNG